jgi:amino acid permease
VSFGLELVALQNVMAIWLPEEKYIYIWITIFFGAIVLFNLLNVRRYGEIEYWLTVTKLTTIVGLIILGLVLSMGASAKTRQLGTSLDNTAIPCPGNAADGQCLGTPGFECTSISESIDFRLGVRTSFSHLDIQWRPRTSGGLLGSLRSFVISRP